MVCGGGFPSLWWRPDPDPSTSFPALINNKQGMARRRHPPRVGVVTKPNFTSTQTSSVRKGELAPDIFTVQVGLPDCVHRICRQDWNSTHYIPVKAVQDFLYNGEQVLHVIHLPLSSLHCRWWRWISACRAAAAAGGGRAT